MNDQFDLSNETFWKWDDDFNRNKMDISFSQHALHGWQECRRRTEAKLDAQARELKAQIAIDAQLVRNNDSLRDENERLKELLREGLGFADGSKSDNAGEEYTRLLDEYCERTRKELK